MKLIGEVMSLSTDNRAIVDTKTGQAKNLNITNVLLKAKDGEIFSCRSYNLLSVVPEIGKPYTLEVRKLEKQGLVNNVVF